MIVADASVIVEYLVGFEPQRIRQRLDAEHGEVPQLLDLEVIHALRRMRRRGALDEGRALEALEDLAALPFSRAPHQPLTGRMWELRHNLTPYDAVYVALAEALEVPLLTSDRALATAPGLTCEVELLA